MPAFILSVSTDKFVVVYVFLILKLNEKVYYYVVIYKNQIIVPWLCVNGVDKRGN